MDRKHIEMKRVSLTEFLEKYQGSYPDDLMLVNVRGCNGAGKSSIPLQLLAQDRGAFIFTIDGKDKVTCFPSFGFVAMGRYRTKTGGLDGFKGNDETVKVLDLLWQTPFSILMEGVISSTIFSTYAELFKNLETRENPKRSIGIMNLVPPLETALARVQSRNGGKLVDTKAITSKWNTVDRNADKFLAEGLNSWKSDNSGIELEETADWFLTELAENMKFGPSSLELESVPSSEKLVIKDISAKDVAETEHRAFGLADGEFLRNMKREIKPYWENKYLNVPDNSVKLRLDPKTGKTFWDMYWENLVERQNIWYKRVMLGEPAPWTEDPVMGQYHFTNVDRKLDRVTLFYIDNVLPNLKDTDESRKFLILNTFIYRLFVRPATWEVLGYIHPETWEHDWEQAKARLRKHKADGNTVFTDAYYVNDLKAANPNPETNSDKTENSICLIQYVIDNLDEMSMYMFNSEHNMESVVNYFTRIPGVGLFNSYEACLDFGMVTEFTGIPFVDWTADYWPNVGPGCKKGIDYVFENKGNMSYTDIVFFMGTVWRSELERLGLEYRFQPGTSELDLRCLEGWFCESQKYFNYYATENGYDFAQGKRPKKKMNLRTPDTEWLKPRNIY
ncbi:hypothetical protein D3C74_51180 [compost metagenome]